MVLVDERHYPDLSLSVPNKVVEDNSERVKMAVGPFY